MQHHDHNVIASPSSHSIFSMLNQVMTQVEYHGFADLRFKRIHPFYKELCFIIAEVFVLNRDSVIKINGDDICTSVVQDVFSQIRNHHLCLVFYNFHKVNYRVFNKKAFLRTSIYNAFFEYDSHYVNEVAYDALNND